MTTDEISFQQQERVVSLLIVFKITLKGITGIEVSRYVMAICLGKIFDVI
jgi:hypothetical protein